MSRRSHVILIAVPLLVLAGATGLRAGVSAFIRGWQNPAPAQSVPDASKDVISTFTLVGHTDAGRKKWEVQGESADLLAEKVELSPVAAKSYGDVELNLNARRGRYDKATQDIELEKQVVLTTSDGARLTTETLHWISQRETGSTRDWVTVTRPGMTLVGLGGTGYPKLKRVRLEKQVTLTMQGKSGQTVITCDGPMEVDYARRKARFWRNVVVRDAKGSIRSDRLDVALAPGSNQLEKASFWGHVEIRQKNHIAYANRANYWQGPGRTRLAGHTRIVMLPEGEEALGE